MNIFLSGGSAFPCRTPEQFMATAQGGLEDPVLGEIGLGHVQICPQNFGGGVLDEARLDKLQAAYPGTTFRLHANARIMEKPCSYDLGTMHLFPEYTKRLIALLRFLGQPYSIHAAGDDTPLVDQVIMANSLSERAGVPVGIEGLYPSRSDSVLSTWKAYESLLYYSACYALDLSHLNIVRQAEGEAPAGLVDALLSDERCIEVHLSGNDGFHDRHEVVRGDEWWLDLLPAIHPQAVVFYEGRNPAKGV